MATDLPHLALSIRQPWAWAIINAGKDIENRDWSTRFRGPVCIHAAKGMAEAECNGFIRTIHAVSLSRPFPSGETVPSPAALARGGIIGTAEIVDCVSASDAAQWDWEDASERGLLHVWPDATTSIRLRKHDAGRLLDGRTWNQMPGGET